MVLSDLWRLPNEVFQPISGLFTGTYQGAATGGKKVAVPQNIQQMGMLVGGTGSTSMFSKMFGTGAAVATGGGTAAALSIPNWLIAGGAGVAGGALLFSGKKGDQITNQNQYTNTNTFSRQDTKLTNITGDWSTNVISNSPYASQKKGSISGQAGPANPVLTPSVSVSPTQEAKQASGTDFATIAAILGVAFVAATYFKGKSK